MKWDFKFLSQTTEQELNSVYGKLSASRKAHVDSMKHSDSQKRTLLGELLVRKLLVTEYGIDLPEIVRAESGQPIVVNDNVFISIAHSGELVTASVDTKRIGIDCEKIREVKPALIKRVCLPDEEAYILSGSDANVRFCEIWTAKEAYFKMIGTGITDFKSVNVLALNRQVYRMGDYIVQTVSD